MTHYQKKTPVQRVALSFRLFILPDALSAIATPTDSSDDGCGFFMIEEATLLRGNFRILLGKFAASPSEITPANPTPPKAKTFTEHKRFPTSCAERKGSPL